MRARKLEGVGDGEVAFPVAHRLDGERGHFGVLLVARPDLNKGVGARFQAHDDLAAVGEEVLGLDGQDLECWVDDGRADLECVVEDDLWGGGWVGRSPDEKIEI